MPAFGVVEVDSFPADSPANTFGYARWWHDGTAVIYIRRDLSLEKKLKTLHWCVDELEKCLTPDGTSYWEGLRLAARNDAPARSRRKAPQLALAVAQ